jgi:thiol-disulfide isomerase/thioredoxin
MSDADPGRDERRRKPGSRYSIFVGIAFLIVIVVATANTLRTRDDGILGTSSTEKGEPLPQFAVPELLGATEGDANVFQDDCETGSNPCPADERRTPACQVDLPEVIRVCDLFDRPLVISFWFTGGADCLPTQDLVDQVARRFAGRVNFLSIDIRDDRDAARAIVREHGWRIPVGWDGDGAVSNLYRVGVCPTVAFAYPGGLLSEAKLGSEELSAEQLTAGVERLIRESDARAREDR